MANRRAWGSRLVLASWLLAAEEVPGRVAKTWQYCEQIVEQPLVRAFLPLFGRQIREFTSHFSAMSRAYAKGALSYGIFAARKP